MADGVMSLLKILQYIGAVIIGMLGVSGVCWGIFKMIVLFLAAMWATIFAVGAFFIGCTLIIAAYILRSYATGRAV